MSNKKLPVAEFREQIVSTVASNPVTVITAETGAGKSTQVPQYLLDEGYNIVVTQPRRLAARTVAERVAEEYGCEFGDIVGFRTAHDRQDSDNTRCLFVTDGLALVRELMGAGTHDCLILDEVHEWNLNIEVLVAWVKKQVARNPKFKVVLMSATLEAEKLASFFGGAPIIEVPGRTFPVEERKVGESLHDDIVELARQGRNVLVFQPGKAEIEETVRYLENLPDLDARVLPLHGGLTKEQQAACFKNYHQPKIVVSTNVAQTSVTIDDIIAVVDSGMERRVELVDGVEGLYLRPISLADAKQRRGRAGRTKPGIYIDHCPAKPEDRREFPMAEILRVRLDQTVLRLAMAGFDMEELRFFHQPNIAEIHEAKRALHALGCMDENGKVTEVGRAVSRLPVSVQYGRMIVEAEKLGVVGDVIKIAAILEQDGITARKVKLDDRWVEAKPLWLPLTNGEKESDALAQLNVYENAQSMSKSQMYESGVFVKDFYFAKERVRLLKKALERRVRHMDSTGKREDILRAVLAGMVDHLYKYNYGDYQNGDGVNRRINKDSVVSGGDWIVGKPFDLEINGRYGPFTINLVTMVTKADPMILAEVAPQLVTIEAGLSPRYSVDRGCVVSTTKTLFNGMVIKEEEVDDINHPEASAILDEQAWKEWKGPEILVPDFSLAGELPAEIPEIREEVYIKSRVDGRPLSAYGVVYHDSWSGWKSKWTRDRKEAESLHEQAEKKLAELRKQKAVRDCIERELDAVNRRREAIGLSPIKMRDSGFSHNGWSRDYTEEKWEKVLQETADKEAEAAAERARAEKEAKEARLIEEGAFTGFTGVWCRRSGSNQGDGWVIRPGGSFREHDSIDNPRPRYKSEGYKSWNVVRPDELAISWRKHTRASEHEFEVAHLPESLTAEQVKAMETLLEELEEAWDGATGLASGKKSPSVGEGWVNPETGESLTKGFRTSRQKREGSEASWTGKAGGVEEETNSVVYETGEVDFNNPFAALAALKGKL